MSRKSKKEILSGLIVPSLLYFSQYGRKGVSRHGESK